MQPYNEVKKILEKEIKECIKDLRKLDQAEGYLLCEYTFARYDGYKTRKEALEEFKKQGSKIVNDCMVRDLDQVFHNLSDIDGELLGSLYKYMTFLRSLEGALKERVLYLQELVVNYDIQ